MSCSTSRINNIETLLRSDKTVPLKDLIYYLKCNTKNNHLKEKQAQWFSRLRTKILKS